MLLPNAKFILQKSGGNDVYGQPVPGKKTTERGSIVKFPVTDVKSSVRSDSSASRGNAHEFQADAVVLLTANTAAVLHDIMIIRGLTLKISAIHPRYNAQGVLDHFETTLIIWTQ